MKRRDWLYLTGYAAIAILLSWLLALLAIRDRTAELPLLWSTLAKALIILLLLYYARLSGTDKYLICGRTVSRNAWWLLLPLVGAVLMYFGVPNTIPAPLTAVMTLLAVTGAVVWEEFYFRFLGRLLFERCGKYHLLVVMLTSSVYGLSQLFHAMYRPLGVVSCMMLFILSMAQGIFLTALYSKSKNILLPLAAHFVQDAAEVFFRQFCTVSDGVFGRGDVFGGLLAVAYTAVGFWLLFFSYHIRERRRGVPSANAEPASAGSEPTSVSPESIPASSDSTAADAAAPTTPEAVPADRVAGTVKRRKTKRAR